MGYGSVFIHRIRHLLLQSLERYFNVRKGKSNRIIPTRILVALPFMSTSVTGIREIALYRKGGDKATATT